MRDDVLQVVVEGILLGRELLEEEPSEIPNALGLVLDALGHLSELALNLDHPVEDEMSKDHESVLLDSNVLVGESLVKAVAARAEEEEVSKGSRVEAGERRDEPVLVDHVAEADGHVSEGDDDVASDDGLLGVVEDAEE